MTARPAGRRARAAAAAALLALALAGCGQRGPLTLPGSAQPIQRLDPSAQRAPAAPAAQPGSGGASDEAAAPREGEPDTAEDTPPQRPPQRTENER
jgi:predicted small lipoprotein YifL